LKRTLDKFELGKYLKLILDELDLTQMQAAQQIGIAPRVVQQILHPERETKGISLKTYNLVVSWKPKKVKKKKRVKNG
jgi:hypothetical protein